MNKQIAMNKRNTVILVMGFVVLIAGISALIGYVLRDWSWIGYAVVGAIVYVVIQYALANMLLVAMTGAKEIRKRDNPRLYNIIENLSREGRLPMPKVYIIQDSAPNAFASGRDPKHAIVAATTGLLDVMNDEEVRAVMAHEMSHVKNYDIRVSMIVFGLVAVVGAICDLGIRMMFWGSGYDDDEDRSPVGMFIVLVVVILAPIVATIAQLAVSRQREYLADMSAAKMLKNPGSMIAALRKLQEHGRPMRRQNSAAASLFINSPMKANVLTKIFSTHPTLEDRIQRLERAKGQIG